MSAAVHAWPVITLTFGAAQIVADAHGEVLTYPVIDADAAHEVAAEAAAAACQRLGLTVCRVQGHTEDGAVFEMVVDAELGTLGEYEAPVAAPTSGRRASRMSGAPATRTARPRDWTQRRRTWAVWGSVGVLALTAGTAAAKNLTGTQGEPVAVVHTPPPAQLPVPAPAGWDTYAVWSTPMGASPVPAILDWAGRPVSVDGHQLTGHDPDTGVQQWTRTAPFTVTQMALFTVEGQTRLAAATSKDLVLFTPDSADPIRVEVPQEATVVLEGGTAPRLDLPTQKSLLVRADGSTVSRVVPAAADPLEAQGQDLIAADTEAGKVWRIGTDSAALPTPAVLPAPAQGAEITGVLGSVQGRVVAAWKDGKRTVVGFYDVEESTEVTSVQQVAVRELDGAPLSTSAVQTDRDHGLLLASRVLIDVQAATVHRLHGQGELSAGHAWVTADGNQTQITPQGRIAATTRSDQAAVPDVLTANGMAITRADSAGEGALYALVETGPTPSPTPTTTTQESPGWR